MAPKVAAEIESWLRHLGDERRFSPKTLEAYRRDVLQFLAFLAEHLGGAPSLKDLASLEPADVRAFMAARRAEGIGSRSLMRTLAGMRGFARYPRSAMARAGSARSPPCVRRKSAGRCRGRCRSRRRSASPNPNFAPATVASLDSCARRRGAGFALWRRLAHFRSASASSASDFGSPRRHHRNRQGQQAAHGAGAAAGGRNSSPIISRSAPMISARTAHCSSAPRAARFGARHPAGDGAAARRARTSRDGDAACACAIPSPRIFWPAAAICARSRNSSATLRWRRHRSTPKSTPSG